jgi:major type 1 subunit fimbrin (pilin)
MKNSLVSLLTLSVTLLSSSADAADGRIDFTGAILTQTCTIGVNGELAPNPAVVRLSPMSAPTLNANPLGEPVSGRTTGFNIRLQDCTAAGNAYAYFEPGPTVDVLTGHLINTGTAANVDLVLVNITGQNVIVPGSPQTDNQRYSTSSGAANMFYGVSYARNGSASAGTVRAAVTYTVAYD